MVVTLLGRAVVGCAGVLAVTALAGCGSAATPPPPSATPSLSGSPAPTSSASGPRAVVLVSGLATQTPFTTSGLACTEGLSAGNSVSALRDTLVQTGEQVFSAPAQIGAGPVASTTGVGESAQCPEPVAARMTIDTTADIDAGGIRLARFIRYLHRQYQVEVVDLVGHSMGGLFARAATGRLRQSSAPVSVRSLTTLSTPWTGTFPADYAAGDLPLTVCGSEAMCQQVLTDYKAKLADVEGPDGAANVITTAELQGRRGWNRQQGGDLAGIPVTLIGGDHYQLTGGASSVWPNDAVVAEASALARGISGQELKVRACLVRPDVHTIGIAEQAGLPWTDAITWDPEVLAAVREAVRSGAGPGDRTDC